MFKFPHEGRIEKLSYWSEKLHHSREIRWREQCKTVLKSEFTTAKLENEYRFVYMTPEQEISFSSKINPWDKKC